MVSISSSRLSALGVHECVGGVCESCLEPPMNLIAKRTAAISKWKIQEHQARLHECIRRPAITGQACLYCIENGAEASIKK